VQRPSQRLVLLPTHLVALTSSVTAAPHRLSDARQTVGKTAGRAAALGMRQVAVGCYQPRPLCVLESRICGVVAREMILNIVMRSAATCSMLPAKSQSLRSVTYFRDRGLTTPSGQRHAADAAETITSKYRISNQPAFPVARAAQ
jgi:hypothetical protein